MNSPSFTTKELADRFGLALQGDPDISIDGVSTLAAGSSGELGFLANSKYRSALPGTALSAVVLQASDAENCSVTALISTNVYADFARIAALFEPREPITAGIHPSAVIDPSATIDPRASVGPLCSIGPRSVVAAGVEIGPGCSVGEDCFLGEDSRLVARITLVRRVTLGSRVLIHPGAVLGADGFGIAFDAGRWLKVPQLGGVRIGDDCEIGANTTIDRGAIEDTVLEEDVRLDNQIQIGHNVRIGAHTAIAGCSAVAGSTQIGRYCLIGGSAGIAGHLQLADRVTVQAMTLVTRSLKESGEYGSGMPAQESRRWRRTVARLRRLDSDRRGSNKTSDTSDSP